MFLSGVDDDDDDWIRYDADEEDGDLSGFSAKAGWRSRSISPDGSHTNRRIRWQRVKAFLPKDEAMVAIRRDRSGSVNYLEEDD